MVKPIYINEFVEEPTVEHFVEAVRWVELTSARYECFMFDKPFEYEYSKGRGKRVYTAVDFHAGVLEVQNKVNEYLATIGMKPMNGCFLNRYDTDKQAIGWHADDFVGMDHEAPVCVVSYGEPREIWWREIGSKGAIPNDQRQLLGNGSLFIMPPGMQHTHFHKIPKGDRPMNTRVSLTSRRFAP